MRAVRNFNSLKTDLLLFAAGFGIYFFYFHHAFLNINSVLSSITDDSLKNYYTFLYHVKNDPSLLNFSGMNFPFGEHIVYTDGQPALAILLKALPFTHNYLIGILHSLIFLSFIVSPLILHRVFRRLDLPALPSAFLSLGITLLSPQFPRIYEGHYALAYACMIPFCMLLILRLFEARTAKRTLALFSYNLLIFFIHPYLALGLCVFSFLSVLIFALSQHQKETMILLGGRLFVAGILPIVLFKLTMLLSDTHVNRPTEPFGLDTSVTTAGSLLTPMASPFRSFLESVFHTNSGDFEGYCYLGLALICILLLCLIALPFVFKKVKLQKEALSLFIASLLLLFFAFGWHNNLMSLLHIHSATLNQFRAAGRFSWFFYYALPVLLFSSLYHSLKDRFNFRTLSVGLSVTAFLFFALNLTETGALIKLYEKDYWKDRNFFNTQLLSAAEKQAIADIEALKPQAIIPLPTYYIGSEIYDRVTGEHLAFTLIPSVIFSYHTHTPVLSTMLSRSSISETEAGIDLLNSYKKDRAALAQLSDQPFVVIRTKTDLLPDEERLWQKITPLHAVDSVQIGMISHADFLKPVLDKKTVTIAPRNDQKPDSNAVVFVYDGDKPPFVFAKESDYDPIFNLDSGQVRGGRYISSLHYYYKNGSWRDVLFSFLVTKTKHGVSEWYQFVTIRTFSGFYKDYAVFEYPLTLEDSTTYGFFIKRSNDRNYKISDFMLRPEGTSVKVVSGRDTSYNNFPIY